MGLYRFALAAIVVMFHYGHLPWLAGRVAVYGFYFISGLLIARALDVHYLHSAAGLGRFYVNRALRLLPLLAAVVVATWLLIAARGGAPYQPDDRSRLPEHVTAADLGKNLASTLLPALDARTYGGYPFLALQMPTQLIPQSWSVGIELLFYLIAPLLVLTGRWRPGALAGMLLMAVALFAWGLQTTHGEFDAVENHLYKNAISSMALFVAGTFTYFASRGLRVRFSYGVMTALLASGVIYLVTWSMTPPWSSAAPSNTPFVVHVFAMIPMGLVVALTEVPERFRRVDAFIGNLSYGIYLMHYLAASLVLWLVEWWYLAHGTVLLTADSTAFGLTTVAISAACATVGFFAIEAPAERWRTRLRRGAAVKSAPPQRRLMPAPAIRYAILALPIVMLGNIGVQRAGLISPPGPRPVGIRWQRGVDDTARRQYEAEFSLGCAQKDESTPDGRTFTYCLQNTSFFNVRTIVNSPAVEDTSKINRRRYIVQ